MAKELQACVAAKQLGVTGREARLLKRVQGLGFS